MTQDFIPFGEIVSELKRLCAKRVTGTLFIATKANRSAQIILDHGEIVFLYFFNKQGEEALELMSTIRAGRYRFQDGPVSRRGSLPSTTVILEFLASGQMVTSQASENQVSEDRTSGSGLSDKQKSVLESCLAGFIGPMAGIICDDHLGVATDVQSAIEALAAEIPSPAQAVKFRAMAQEKLG